MTTIKLDTKKLSLIHQADVHMQSYNVEMTEVTGGTFWKTYTPGQIEGTEEFESTMNFESLMEVYPPLDFTNKR
ncbi:MAG: hypothetical protein ACRCXA_06765, partial [Peptostreptococcaceae bacterium]